MTSDDLRDRLEDLETQFGVGPTATVIVNPTGSHGDEDLDWPDDVARDDIMVTNREEPVNGETLGWERPLVPWHRPPQYRGGIVIMSEKEVAHVYASMPDDVREKELEYRVEQSEPIPPLLQQ